MMRSIACRMVPFYSGWYWDTEVVFALITSLHDFSFLVVQEDRIRNVRNLVIREAV